MPTVTASAASPGATGTPYSRVGVAYAPTYASRVASTGRRNGTKRDQTRQDVRTPLREETGAAAARPAGTLIAGQIDRVHQTVTAVTGRGTLAGREPDEVSREVLLLLDDMEGLLGEKVLNYAVRPSE